MQEIELNEIYHGDCLELMKRLSDGSVDVVLTDPPYLYLKNQKLDVPFDEQAFFSECDRVIKVGGFIVLFGRGTSFYRWNTILADLGFSFKEEIIWNKAYSSSPLMAISRVHETISIHSKGQASVAKVKIPYLEMKRHDMPSIIQDVKRLRSALGNTKALDAVLHYLETNEVGVHGGSRKCAISLRDIVRPHRCTSVVNSIKTGMNEKSIIRTDYIKGGTTFKHDLVGNNKSAGTGNRCVNAIHAVYNGMNEKSIVRQGREHYGTIHPTQKPPRLLERLLNLVSKEGDLVLDPFAGSCNTAKACINLNRKYLCMEIDEEYYTAGCENIKDYIWSYQI